MMSWVITTTCIICVDISFNTTIAGKRHFKKASDQTAITDIVPRTQLSTWNTTTALQLQ